MSSIKRVCIYFTLMLYVGGPGEVLFLIMGHLHLGMVIRPISLIPGYSNRRVLYYNVIHTVLHITILKIYCIYYTILYNVL